MGSTLLCDNNAFLAVSRSLDWCDRLLSSLTGKYPTRSTFKYYGSEGKGN